MPQPGEKEKDKEKDSPSPIPPASAASELEMENLRKQTDELRKKESEKEKLIQETSELAEAKSVREALGLDLEFDVDKLIRQGVIEKKGIKVPITNDLNLYVDMHTLTKPEEAMVDQMVIEVFGVMPTSRSYYEVRSAAIAAMSVTRCNNTNFPVPDPFQRDRQNKEWKNAWERKMAFYRDFMLKVDSDTVETILFIYRNLDGADPLINEEAKKKS